VGQKAENEELIIQYLLGDLPEKELSRVEDHYFDDDAFFEEMAIVEEELIDDYVRGHLAGRDREKFENSFLVSPARRERVEFSRTLMKSLSVEQPAARPSRRESVSWFQSLFVNRNRAFQFACAALALLLAAGATWLAIENARLRNDIARLHTESAAFEEREKELAEQAAKERERGDGLKARAESEQNERQQLEQQLARSQPQPVAILELASNATRSGGSTKSFNIPSGAKIVELKLYTEPSDYKIYRVMLQTADGEKVWSKDGLKARTTSTGKVVIARLPADLLSSRDYILTLGGAAAGGDYDDAGMYSFKVAKK
jgi:anti-sigma factor RsiW